MRDRLPDQDLVLAETVEAGGIKMVVTAVQRVIEDAGPFLGRRWYAIGMGQTHAAQAYGLDIAARDIAQTQSGSPI